MATCNASTLLSSVKCYDCIGDIEFASAVAAIDLAGSTPTQSDLTLGLSDKQLKLQRIAILNNIAQSDTTAYTAEQLLEQAKGFDGYSSQFLEFVEISLLCSISQSEAPSFDASLLQAAAWAFGVSSKQLELLKLALILSISGYAGDQSQLMYDGRCLRCLDRKTINALYNEALSLYALNGVSPGGNLELIGGGNLELVGGGNLEL